MILWLIKVVLGDMVYGRYHIWQYKTWCLSIIRLVVELQLEMSFGCHGGEVRQIFGWKIINWHNLVCEIGPNVPAVVQK